MDERKEIDSELLKDVARDEAVDEPVIDEARRRRAIEKLRSRIKRSLSAPRG